VPHIESFKCQGNEGKNLINLRPQEIEVSGKIYDRKLRGL